jgi:TPR repeat protein
MNNLSELYAKGNGVSKDCATARHWLKKAIVAGYENAKQNLRSGFNGQCKW